MNKKPHRKDGSTENSTRTGPVTREMVGARARELALIAGHPPPHVSQTDYERAKRELTGESEIDRQEAVLESLPEAKRWDPMPGSSGHQAPESPHEDEDDEGQSETEQIVDDGVEAAERDQKFQAAIEAAKKAHS